MTHRSFIFGALAIAALSFTNAAQADCGKVTMAEMNWASAELMANVDAFIMKHGYGCDVELVPGATTTTFPAMNEKGKPDVAGELWVNSIRIPLAEARKEGRIHVLNKGPISDLGEGWWIPPHTAKKYPELKTVLDVLKRPDLFPHPEDKSKGAFIGCPAGWACQIVNANLFRAFEMEKKGWILVDPGSAAGLDGSMTKAVERGQNWFGYYWSPTSIIGKHKMVKLPFGVPFAGEDNWENCLAKPQQACADPKPSAWTKSEANTVVTDKFKKTGGPVLEYLGKRVFPGNVMNEMLVYMKENQAQGSDAAIEFLTKHESVWTGWLSADMAAKVKAALK